MRRRGLVAAMLGAASPAGALAPCPSGTGSATLVILRFGLLAPNGDDITEAQWQRFRSEVMEPVLRTRLMQHDEPPPQRIRTIRYEVPLVFDPMLGNPPPFPPATQSVIRAWRARFPDAPLEPSLAAACVER